MKNEKTDQPSQQGVIVMTGATSGLGVHAVQHLSAQPGTLIIVGARGSGKIVPEGVEVIPLDLASLASVREFATNVKKRLGQSQIDILILNAGVQNSKETLSADGYDLTFAVNHLSHYLSVLAQNRDAQDLLWRESAAMVGLN